MPTLHPPKIPSLHGKTILITGGTAGLGATTLLSLASHNPAQVFFTGRNASAASNLISRSKQLHPSVPLTFIRLDLASLTSIKTAAASFLSQSNRLDLLFANAGVMALPPGLTEDGYEVQFGTNHLGHAALVKLLLPLLEATAKLPEADVRIVWNTSQGYRFASGIAFESLKTTQACLSPFWVLSEWVRYGQSKLANILYAREVGRRVEGVTSVVIHPGVSFTGLVTGLGAFNRWFVWATTLGVRVSVEECSWNQQWAAVAPLGEGEGEVKSGVYYEPVGVRGALSKAAGDEALAGELWEWTQGELARFRI